MIANIDCLERKDRTAVTLAAIIPDADGLGIFGDVASKYQGAGLTLYG